MKIKVEFTLDVDPEAWSDEYGTDHEDVRRDVREHAEQSVLALFNSIGVLA